MALNNRIVVVGLGSIGRRHARLLARRSDIAVELCDSNPQMLEESMEEIGELPQHLSFEKMLETKPNMVLIATPHKFHTEQTIRALQAGAHVLCEKPMSDQWSKASTVLETKKNFDQILVYGFSNHFHPGILKIKKIIDNGDLGEILYVHSHIGTYGTLINSLSRYQTKIESALLMDYVHQPDLLYWLLGKNPKGVYASGSTGENLELSSKPNSITLLLDYDTPLTTSIHLNYLQYPDRYHYEFIGDKGWIYYDLISNSLMIGNRKDNIVRKKKIQVDRDHIYIAEHQAFFDTIEGKRLPESSAEDALQSMIVLEAAIQSWKSKKRIELKSIYN
jgi:predicted dehydrogenase